MGILNRLILIVIVMLAVACQGGGGSGDEDEEENDVAAEEQEAGAAINGDYLGELATLIRVVDLGSNTPPVEDDCEGDIEIVVDDGQADEIIGDGVCNLVAGANVASYSVAASFVNDTDFEGEISFTFSGVVHVHDIEGSLVDGEIEASFAGRSIHVGNLAIDWDGDFVAELDD